MSNLTILPDDSGNKIRTNGESKFVVLNEERLVLGSKGARIAKRSMIYVNNNVSDNDFLNLIESAKETHRIVYREYTPSQILDKIEDFPLAKSNNVKSPEQIVALYQSKLILSQDTEVITSNGEPVIRFKSLLPESEEDVIISKDMVNEKVTEYAKKQLDMSAGKSTKSVVSSVTEERRMKMLKRLAEQNGHTPELNGENLEPVLNEEEEE